MFRSSSMGIRWAVPALESCGIRAVDPAQNKARIVADLRPFEGLGEAGNRTELRSYGVIILRAQSRDSTLPWPRFLRPLLAPRIGEVVLAKIFRPSGGK